MVIRALVYPVDTRVDTIHPCCLEHNNAEKMHWGDKTDVMKGLARSLSAIPLDRIYFFSERSSTKRIESCNLIPHVDIVIV